MAGELVLLPKINKPYLLNDNKEKQIKVCLSIMPSEEVRRKFVSNSTQFVKEQGTDVCIVLDVSGSMREIISGEVRRTGQTKVIDGKTYNVVEGGTSKLDAALSAIKRLIPLLRESDTLSFIAYEDTSHVIFDGYKSKDSDLILSKLNDSTKYTGNTNISGALCEARMLLSRFDKARPKKIIFLTDGQPYGDTEENGIIQAKLLADNNISIDCLGFGDDFNYAFMEKIAAPSKGRTNIIKTPEEAERIFEDLFRKSQEVVATNAKLKLDFSPHARVTEHYRGTPENLYLGKVKLGANERTFTLNLGQIERDQRYDYYFLVTVPAQEGYSGAFRVMKAEVEYFIPSLYADVKEKSKKNIIVEFGGNPEYVQVNGEIESDYSLAEIKRLEDEADEARNNNRPAEAISRYEEIIQKLEVLGKVREVQSYREVLEKYRRTGNLSNTVVNEARRSTSQAAKSGTLKAPLGDKEFGDIFGTEIF